METGERGDLVAYVGTPHSALTYPTEPRHVGLPCYATDCTASTLRADALKQADVVFSRMTIMPRRARGSLGVV